MNYGLYLSASGVLTQMYRQDVFANNLANVQTAGFKRDLATVAQRSAEAVEDNLGSDVRSPLLDKLGGGALPGPQSIDFTPAAPHVTGNPLDVTLTDKHQFFAVRKALPSGQQEVRLTRDGRFSRSPQGILVKATSGETVLDTQDQPITLGPGQAEITADGRVLSGGQEVGRLQVARVANLDGLVKDGLTLLRMTGPDARVTEESPQLRTGASEASGVDPIRELMDLINTTKSLSAGATLMQYHDTLMDRAVNTLGRLA